MENKDKDQAGNGEIAMDIRELHRKGILAVALKKTPEYRETVANQIQEAMQDLRYGFDEMEEATLPKRLATLQNYELVELRKSLNLVANYIAKINFGK